MSKLILVPQDECTSQDAGGKAASLYELRELPIPQWFVVTPRAFKQSSCDPDDLSSWKLDGGVEEQINAALSKLSSSCQAFAVRSSAVDEDGKDHSFAGQFESYLGVKRDEIPARVVDVWKSAFSERIKIYRKEHQLGECRAPAVIIQELVAADCAGVAFAVDPVSGRWGQAVVSSTWGLGSSLVDGVCDGDTFTVDLKGNIISTQVGQKSRGAYVDNGKVEMLENKEKEAGQQSLQPDQVAQVARLARYCSQLRGAPQDIEWAFAGDKLYLLQSRPITGLGKIADPDGVLNIWDNSNIAESYGGVTTPLTYSFARSIYEDVYRQFCKIMGVPQHVITENNETFRGLLGLMQGRMYYNLINWYKLLACFPGFSINREFMEQMMGVQKELGEELLELIPKRKNDRVKNIFHLLKSLGGMGLSYVGIKRTMKKFYGRLDLALAPPAKPISEQRADELVSYYRDLEQQLLLKWDAPLINDFFAMIFFGILTKLCKSWCGDENSTLQNDLVGGSGRVISAEPAKKVAEMAELVHEDHDLVELLQKGSAASIVPQLKTRTPQLYAQYEKYIEKFGDRCVDELKLESVTLHEDPLPLLRAIGHFAGATTRGNRKNLSLEARVAAEEKVQEILGNTRWKKMVFNMVLTQARARVEDRENLRFERTRLFGRVRQIFVELGRRFEALKVLPSGSDIFYLEKDEILSYVSGFSSCPDIQGVAAVRKEHFEKYREAPPIADRFQTRGLVFLGNDFTQADEDVVEHQQDEGERKGIGCCPGKVKGKVRVVRDPKGVELASGEILVAERTDPGWIMLFPAASGLLVEKGSLLSHSAIVARELGLPAVVSVPGITTWLKDGDLVEFDGSTGKVKMVDEVT